MKKELVIKVIKGVGAVTVTGLGIKAIVKNIELKKQRDQLDNKLFRASIKVKAHETFIEFILDDNKRLFEENLTLKESMQTKKKKA